MKNWYKTSQEKDKKDKKPYRIFKVIGGQPDQEVNIPSIYAYSAEQARASALRQHLKLREFVNGCIARRQECDIRAKVDETKLREIIEHQKSKKENVDKFVQNAWWNQ